jgi:dephospho-CoA kinase
VRILRPDGSPLLLVGLTGGIATGKSTVSGMFRELDAAIVDADAIVHELLGAGGLAVGPVLALFGDGVRDAAGGVDRARLAEFVFRDEESRKKLESVVHPLVVATSEVRMTEAGGRAELVVYDAALLVETGRFAEFDRLVVVVTSTDVQLRRLMDRDGLTAQEAGARVRSQAPLSRKAELADYVIDNSGHWGETRRQVAEVWRQLQDDARLLRAGRPLPRRRAVP